MADILTPQEVDAYRSALIGECDFTRMLSTIDALVAALRAADKTGEEFGDCCGCGVACGIGGWQYATHKSDCSIVRVAAWLEVDDG